MPFSAQPLEAPQNNNHSFRPAVRIFLPILIFLVLVLVYAIVDRQITAPLIGVVTINGVVLESESTIKKLQILENDPAVKGIIVRINSPGGAVAPSQEIFTELLRFKKKKLVYTSIASVAASGGYYIAVGSDKIFANPGSLTGSIGVIAQLPNLHGSLERIGAHVVVIPSTPATKKTIGSPFLPWDEANRDYFQKLPDSAHNRFVDVIYQGRNKHFPDRARLEKLANGEILTAAQALDAKLIDRDHSYFEDAQAKAAELAGLSEPKVVKLTKVPSLREALTGAAQNKTALINIDASALDQLTTPRLLYLWQGQ